MRTTLIVFLLPGFDQLLSLLHVHEPVDVQAFRPERPIEAFDERVVGWLTRPGEVDLHSILVGPQVHRMTGELAAVAPHEGTGRNDQEEGGESGRGSEATEIRLSGPWLAVGLLAERTPTFTSGENQPCPSFSLPNRPLFW